MKTQQPFKILWLTDIHFSGHYAARSDRGELEKYIGLFLEQVRLSIDKGPFSYIFITGDLAQEGTKSDFDQFWELLLKKLLDLFLEHSADTLPLLLTIPGNHDLYRAKGKFLNEFVASLGANKADWPRRKQYLQENEKKFYLLFKDYMEFMTGCHSRDGGKYARFFDMNYNTALKVSKSYRSNRLYGHIVDINRQMIIVLLNSAWYSLGENFDERLANKIVAEKHFKKDHAYILAKLKEKDYVSEYSTQLSGVHLLANLELNQAIEDYKDFTVITCVHHPTNWMPWEEYYTYSDVEDENANLLGNIFKHTDILLTGHEHVPVKVSVQDTDAMMHLKGGCFLAFHRNSQPFSFENNWFSILRYEPSGKKFYQDRIFITGAPSGFQFTKNIHGPYSFHKKDDKVSLTPRRLLSIQQSAKRGRSDLNRMYRFLRTQDLIDGGATSLMQLKIPAKFRQCMSAYSTDGPKHEIYFIIQSEFSYNRLDKSFFNFLEQTIDTHEGQKTFIRFIIPDIYALDSNTPASTNHYHPAAFLREDAFRKLVKWMDGQFDRFRHHFFEKYNTQRMSPAFNAIQHLRFANHIIPYWIYEKIWV